MKKGLSLIILTLLIANFVSAQPSVTNGVYLPIIIRSVPPQPSNISFWGMNLYLSKRERISAQDNLDLLADRAIAAGVRWTREELPWDLIEPVNNSYQTIYDADLTLAAHKGLGIIGMLLTTPVWARDPSCPSNFWCPPADVNEYAQFAAWMVERYDGDKQDDAPGSPRIAYWQIWNEPNDTQLWPDIGADANVRKRRYGDMLVAAYSAIKTADPTATVLIGGTYIYDGSCAGGICDGFNFLNAEGGVFQQVPAARQAFDIFAIHPYIPTNRPDDPAIPRILTVEGRIYNARDWLDNPAIGRTDAPIWISEVGWCTIGGLCPGGVAVSEENQAAYLVRTLVVAQQMGVQHVSWFQFEDAFNDPNRMWGNAAIVHQYDGGGYPAKPAYHAYRTLATRLANAITLGTGALHTHVFNPAQPFVGDGGTYHYRYTDGASSFDILWRPNDTLQVSLPVTGNSVTQVTMDGNEMALTPISGRVTLNLSEMPILVVQR